MEALTFLLKKTKEACFISGFTVGGRGGEGREMSHLLFTNGTLIFREASKDQFLHLHRVQI